MEGQPGDDFFMELSIGKEEMLYSLNSTLEALEAGSILKEECNIRFDTLGFQHESGCQGNSNPHDFELLKLKVRSTFEAVEHGHLTEDDYYFALITPYFYYRSGNYHKAENLKCTLQALLDTYDEESGNELLQEHIVSTFLEWIDSYSNKFIIVLHATELGNEIREVEADSVGSTHKPFDFIDGSPAKDEQSDKGTFQMLLGVITYLLTISRLLDSQKRGSVADKRITSGIELQLNNCTLILLLGLFAVPIPAAQAAHQETPLTLRAGSNGIIPFNYSVRDPLDVSNMHYFVRFEAKDRPFCVDGAFDPQGFISPDQSERFSTKLYVDINTLTVKINIVPVSTKDEGTYELQTLYNLGSENVASHFMRQVVKVHVPPGPARCSFINSTQYGARDRRLVRCHCRPGSGNSTLSCFQNGAKIPFWGQKGAVTSRTFWIIEDTSPVVCCSHEYGEPEDVTADSCGQQFRFPHHKAKTTVPPITESKGGSVAEDFPKPTEKPTNVMLPKATEEPGIKGSGYVMHSSLIFTTLLPMMTFLIN